MSLTKFWEEQEFQCDIEGVCDETSAVSCPLAINTPSHLTCVRNSNTEKFKSTSQRGPKRGN